MIDIPPFTTALRTPTATIRTSITTSVIRGDPGSMRAADSTASIRTTYTRRRGITHEMPIENGTAITMHPARGIGATRERRASHATEMIRTILPTRVNSKVTAASFRTTDAGRRSDVADVRRRVCGLRTAGTGRCRIVAYLNRNRSPLVVIAGAARCAVSHNRRLSSNRYSHCISSLTMGTPPRKANDCFSE